MLPTALGHAGHSHAHEDTGTDASGDTHDLNMRSALRHMISDGAVSVGVALAGLVILLTGGWYWLDGTVASRARRPPRDRQQAALAPLWTDSGFRRGPIGPKVARLAPVRAARSLMQQCLLVARTSSA